MAKDSQMKWESATVFISSTFNDMHAERDYLIKEVFPELTEWCEKRHIRLTDIDLRWGVTEEDASNSKTIETCLRHVDKSRPFFLCFLGQRRGWVPDFNKDISKETKELYDFNNLKKKDRSATEMEIEHALLEPLTILLDDDNNHVNVHPDACTHSIFFFRDGSYSKRDLDILTDDQRLIYTNEYLKKVDISKVMAKLKGNKEEEGRDPVLYGQILNKLEDDFESDSIVYPQLLSELIYDIQATDCGFYNNLLDNLVNNPTKTNNLVLIAELKFKNPGIFKEITHEIKDNNEGVYDDLLKCLDDYEYEHVGIEEFCECFDYDVIRDIVAEFEEDNQKVYDIHEAELSNIRTRIEDKRDDNDNLNVLINDYKGEWDDDLILPELSHYKFDEGHGGLTNFKSNNSPLKKVIIDQFKEQFELEFKDHIEGIVSQNPGLFKDEKSKIIDYNALKPDSSVDTSLANELYQQENFCHNNSEGFVRRDEYTSKLKEYVESDDNSICLVSAEAGLGKTMLLADFATKFKKNYPNKRLYKRFCGGSDLSSKTHTLWESIIDEAGIKNNENISHPNNIVELRRNINDILKEMAKEDDVVIIIDAINQMEDGIDMLNWFGQLPENLKLIISVKEVFIENNKYENEQEKEEDRKYQEELEEIKNKKTISHKHSFSINSLDYQKQENITQYLENIREYVESDNNNICLINSELNYDKSLIFHLFNDRYSDKKIYNIKCTISNSDCPTNKIKKSVREQEAKTSINIRDITGKVEAVKKELEKSINDIPADSILFIDVMNNNDELTEYLLKIKYNTKTIIGIKNVTSDNAMVDFTIKELDREKNRIIKSYLRNYLKELDEREIHDICNFNGSKNPLYLKILLAELRVFGSFDQLKDEINKFGDSPSTAFKHVFERLENDEVVRRDKIKVAKHLFSLLSSSRVGGLSEEEIVTIIMDKNDWKEKEVQDAVNLNLRQVKPFMARKEGRHDFFYEKFREAAEKYYEDEHQDNIKLLTDYFKNKADTRKVRRYMELPYYLNESGDTKELEKTLSDYSFIKNKLCKSKDVYNLILDYNYLNFEDTPDTPLELIQRALELSSPILINHLHQLPEQLYGRMKDIDDEEIIQQLLEDLEKDTTKKWLKPSTNSLYSPKSSIIKRIQAEGKTTSYLEVTKDKKIIIGTTDGKLSIYDIDENDFFLDPVQEIDSSIVKIILLEDDTQMLVAYSNGIVQKWSINNKDIIKTWDINKEYKAEITDIYYSQTYNKIYASSHTGIFTINLETDEIRKEDIEEKKYNQIAVPRRNEAILVCDEKEVDGWDVYEMRKAYNQHHQHELTEEDIGESLLKTRGASGEIRFMGLIKRFLILISENGQMKMWNTLKNSGSGESIDEIITVSPQDRFAQAITIEEESKVVTMSQMGVLRVYNIPEPRQPNFRLDTYKEDEDNKKDIQTGITDPTAITYYTDNNKHWIIIGNKSNEINIIDLDKQVEETEHTKHIESVLTIKLNNDKMITASDNGEYYNWDIITEKDIDKYSDEFRYDCISYNQSEDKLICCGSRQEEDGRTTYHQATWQKDKHNVEEVTNQIIDVAQNKDGIISIDYENLNVNDDKIQLDIHTKTEQVDNQTVEIKQLASTLDTFYETGETYIGFEDGRLAKYSDNIEYIETENNTPVRKIKSTNDKVFVGYDNGKLEIYDNSLENKKTIEAHDEAITNMYIINENEIITVSEDKTLKIWDIENEETAYTYYLDIPATSINMKDDKIIIGDSLGNVRFFTFVKEKESSGESIDSQR